MAALIARCRNWRRAGDIPSLLWSLDSARCAGARVCWPRTPAAPRLACAYDDRLQRHASRIAAERALQGRGYGIDDGMQLCGSLPHFFDDRVAEDKSAG